MAAQVPTRGSHEKGDTSQNEATLEAPDLLRALFHWDSRVGDPSRSAFSIPVCACPDCDVLRSRRNAIHPVRRVWGEPVPNQPAVLANGARFMPRMWGPNFIAGASPRVGAFR
jgi:hypothetical protein